MSELFTVESASVSYGSAEVLTGVSLSLHSSEFVAIAGPNGAGKSTLLSVLAGLVKPVSGTCSFRSRPVSRWNRREFARRVAVVTQTEPGAFPFTAEDVIFMGRTPHSDGWHKSPADRAAVERALALTETTLLRHREVRTLSGGERQRILLAAALAQTPEALLLDEPANHLDLRHQVALHALLQRLSRDGLLVAAVTHDLNLASAYADRVVLLSDGRVRADAAPSHVLRPDLLHDVFQVSVEMSRTASGRPWMVYGH